MEFDAAGAEGVEHCYQVARTPAPQVQLPNNERVAVFQSVEAVEQSRALRRDSRQSLVLAAGLTPGLLQRCELHVGVLVVGRDAGAAVFHALHFDSDI